MAVSASPSTSIGVRSEVPPVRVRLEYRPALDGLRAVAVGLVLLYHAGYDFVSFGFLGVDLFFVLSGYLVTRVILLALDTDTFSLLRFYERRVRRLLPAATVVLVSMLWLLFLFEPAIRRRDLIPDFRASSLYVANWRFVSASTDYFAEDIAQSPLLHFWSLAIEEQFYFIFPAVLVGTITVGKRLRWPLLSPVVIVVLLIGSAIRQLQFATTSPLRAYYGTDARLYQLLVGVLLAWVLHRWKGQRQARPKSVGTVGVVALCILIALATVAPVSISNAGFFAAGASVILILSLEVAPNSLLARALSMRPLVYYGAISYGVYLWHWPIMVLVRESLGDSPVLLLTLGGAGSLALAALSFQLIEGPAKKVFQTRISAAGIVAIGLAISLVVGLVIAPVALRRGGTPAVNSTAAAVLVPAGSDVSTADVDIDIASLDLEGFRSVSTGSPNCVSLSIAECVLFQAPSDDATKVVLLGDSLAAKLVPMMTSLAAEHEFTFLASTALGCPWQDGIRGYGDFAAACAEMKSDFQQRVLPAFEPDVVLILTATRDDPVRPVALVPEAPFEGASQPVLVATTTASTLERISAFADSIVLIEPVPVPPVDPIECLSANADAHSCSFAASPGPFAIETLYRAAAFTTESVEVLSIDTFACPNFPRCDALVGGLPPYVDQIHIFSEYATDQRAQFWDLAREAVTGDR